MARKRMRRRRDPNTPGSSSQNGQGHTMQPTMIDGKMVHIHQIRNTDEGVLYSHSITVSVHWEGCVYKYRTVLCADYAPLLY